MVISDDQRAILRDVSRRRHGWNVREADRTVDGRSVRALLRKELIEVRQHTADLGDVRYWITKKGEMVLQAIDAKLREKPWSF